MKRLFLGSTSRTASESLRHDAIAALSSAKPLQAKLMMDHQWIL